MSDPEFCTWRRLYTSQNGDFLLMEVLAVEVGSKLLVSGRVIMDPATQYKPKQYGTPLILPSMVRAFQAEICHRPSRHFYAEYATKTGRDLSQLHGYIYKRRGSVILAGGYFDKHTKQWRGPSGVTHLKIGLWLLCGEEITICDLPAGRTTTPPSRP